MPDVEEDAGGSSYDMVEDNLFIGDAAAAADPDLTLKLNRIVSLDLQGPPEVAAPASGSSAPALLHLPIADTPESDLLSELDRVLEFIQEGLQDSRGGPRGVLVHCRHGVSRSAAVLVAHLMRKSGLNPEEALAVLKSKRPQVGPNGGFLDQLRLYWAMGCRLDDARGCPPYRLYKLRQCHHRLVETGALDQEGGSEVGTPTPRAGGTRKYKCRKCRVTLSESPFPHSKQTTITTVSWQSLLKTWNPAEVEDNDRRPLCPHTAFIEPARWMNLRTAASIAGGSPPWTDRLNCSKCNSRVGVISWGSSLSCPCGCRMEPPAFQLNLSKVDVSK